MNKNRKKISLLILASLLAFLGNQLSAAYDNPHFYRATNFFLEPRIEHDWLSSWDIFVAGGSADTARDCNHCTVPLLDLFGTHNMHELGVNVPDKDLSDPLDVILKDLENTVARCNFATFSLCGEFKLIEAYIAYAQNFKRGFFAQFILPIRRFDINCIRFNDLSPCDDACPNIETPIWQTFLANFDAILHKYDLSRKPFCETGIGDLAILAGWTHNYQETDVLDFVDFTVKLGVLVPTSKERDENKIFALPFGYNGHIGIPIAIDLAFGAYEWLNIGLHFDVIGFTNKTRCMRVKTAPCQSGLIKLAKAEVKVDKGSLWTAGTYLKADHFTLGFSLLFGYSFVNKKSDQLTPCNCILFCTPILNDDEMLKGFKMHTLHFALEYDFTKEDANFGPRIAVFYNHQVGGKRIFKTNMVGGNAGIEIAWDF